METLLTLNAQKEKAILGAFAGFDTTTLKDQNGNIKAIFPPEQKQPRRNQKFIMINCFKYKLNWL